MSETAIVIGAGIVGLHVANVLSEKGYEVFVLEKEPHLGEHASGRNSGVIHAGIYYRSGSIKEETCIEGNRLTYEWLEKLKVPHRRCGKWLVPEPGQARQLESFYEQIRKLPIPAPKLIAPEKLREAETQLCRQFAIDVPSTGIVDAAAYVKAMATYLENKGVQIIRSCEVKGVLGQILETSRQEISFDLAVNCAGLDCDRIARMTGLTGYEIRPCRGDYYLLTKKLIQRPVYHLPYQGSHSLGVHLTPTLDDQTLIGPNAFFIEDKLDYRHQSSKDVYLKAIRYYLPDCDPSNIQPAYSGNRPKLFYQGEPVYDFTIIKRDPWIHFLNIESPGLTAAPALAKATIS